MATFYGLALDCKQRKVLGEDVDIQTDSYDETNTRIDVKKLAGNIKASGGLGMVALLGVQTNQFPRAVDLGRAFLNEGIQVSIGGFHVSGSLAMLKDTPVEIQEAMDLGLSLFAGEIEGRMQGLLADAMQGALKPLYNFMQDLPELGGAPVPFLPVDVIRRMTGMRTAFDAGRGCPYSCSFCTIINVQGHKSRFRTADDVEHILRANVAQGINSFFITDDDFARNRQWEPIFDRIIQLREREHLPISFSIQVDTVCHKIPRFIEKAGRAGVNRAFIGMESINPDALVGAGKKQNNITEYRKLLQAWHNVGVLTFAGYILGFPNDTPESIVRDIKIIQKELPVDLLEFFILTPLPGSQDHQELVGRGVVLDTDMNNYDTVHVTAPHARMSAGDWLEIYHRAWETYYTLEHVETIMRRSKAWDYDVKKMMHMTLEFYACATIEKVHPLDGGILRRKYRKDRRYGLSIENPFVFYPKYLLDAFKKYSKFFLLLRTYRKIYKKVMAEELPAEQTDIAMIPVNTAELSELEIYNATKSAQDVAARRIKKLSLAGVS